jgi:hypothetical protein
MAPAPDYVGPSRKFRDEAMAAFVYRGMPDAGFGHASVNHSAGEFVRDDVTTNGAENVFAVLKLGLIGVYHHASKKHFIWFQEANRQDFEAE